MQSAISSSGSRSAWHAQSGFRHDNGGIFLDIALHGRARLNPGTCREPRPSASPFSQVIDKLGHGSGIDGGGAVELLHWFYSSRFVLVQLCLIPGSIIAIQRVGSVMIADPVQDASAVAEGKIAGESKLKLNSTA
jgi:hypothetical protein